MASICIDCSSRKCIELLDTMEKIMLRPIELKNEASKENWKDYQFEDIYLCTKGLIDVFCHRICQYPAMIPIRAYHILVKHLEVQFLSIPYFTSSLVFEFLWKQFFALDLTYSKL